MVNVTLHLYSLATVRIISKFKNQERQGTSFFLRQNNKYYLVTALHILTGRHWRTKKPSNDGFLPDSYIVKFPFYKIEGPRMHKIEWLDLQLRPTTDSESSPWLVHPEHKEDVDVAVIPLDESPAAILKQQIVAGKAEPGSFVYAVDWSATQKLKTGVADEVFIVGFPENIKVTADMAIWKRGSIASEPDYSPEGLPYVLVDAGTRGGMSGGLVVRRERPFEELFGVYSARYGADETTSQLGIVWKKQVLVDILAKPTLGKNTNHTWLWY